MFKFMKDRQKRYACFLITPIGISLTPSMYITFWVLGTPFELMDWIGH